MPRLTYLLTALLTIATLGLTAASLHAEGKDGAVAAKPKADTKVSRSDPDEATDDGDAIVTSRGLRVLDFRKVVKRAKGEVFPAVVFVKCVIEDMRSGRKVSVEATGSGVIISPKGEVLTNWHVVDKAKEVRCLLYDGRGMDAEVIGTDKDTDLALLQLKPRDGDNKPMPYAPFGDSTKLSEGDFVMAMGAPWGMSRSVSIGIISCTRRYLPENSEYSLWLQTDAAISPGNSGGPLINTNGQIVGINTRGIMQGGDLGFSIPAATINYILPQLREFKKVNWSWTGLQLQPLKDFNKNIYFEGDKGVIIAGTEPESPSRRAGLQPRDRMLAVNGKPVTAMTDEDLPAIQRMLGLLPKGKKAKLTIQRDGKELNIDVTPREKGKVEGEELDCPRWDLTAKAINQFDNQDLYYYDKKGVFIYGTKYPGNAAKSGFSEQDVILKVGKTKIETLDDLKKAYEQAVENVKKESRVLITIRRNGQWQQKVLEFSRDYSKE